VFAVLKMIPHQIGRKAHPVIQLNNAETEANHPPSLGPGRLVFFDIETRFSILEVLLIFNEKPHPRPVLVFELLFHTRSVDALIPFNPYISSIHFTQPALVSPGGGGYELE
jgi:hypothetical protein